jgi:hypothetical protein
MACVFPSSGRARSSKTVTPFLCRHGFYFEGGANFTPHASTTHNFANDDRATLLFIAGGNDHIPPAAVKHENFERNVKQSEAIGELD